jgi:hypothetical protein
MAITSFDLYGKFSRQLKSYLAGLGYNEGRDYTAAPYSPNAAAAGHFEINFRDRKAGAEAQARWIAFQKQGFKESG